MSEAESPVFRFRDNSAEVLALLDIHVQLTGSGPGRRRNVDVLNKSAILFACAAFEAFIEDVAVEAFRHLTKSAQGPDRLPTVLKRAIATVLKEDRHELKIWELAGDGWKSVAQRYCDTVLREYAGTFNTPKPHQIDDLFKRLIGLDSISAGWRWNGMKVSQAKEKLKQFVELRGALAHGARPAPKVTKANVNRYLMLLVPLSVRSANHVREYCYGISGSYPWQLTTYRGMRV